MTVCVADACCGECSLTASEPRRKADAVGCRLSNETGNRVGVGEHVVPVVLVSDVPTPKPDAIAPIVKRQARPEIQQGEGVDPHDVQRADACEGLAVVGEGCAYKTTCAGRKWELVVDVR